MIERKENRDKHIQKEKESQDQKSEANTEERKQKPEKPEREKEIREVKAKGEETHKPTDKPPTQKLRPPPTSVMAANRKKLTQKPLRSKGANLQQSSTISIHTYFKRVPVLRETNAKGLGKPGNKSNSDIRQRPIPKGGQTGPETGANPGD